MAGAAAGLFSGFNGRGATCSRWPKDSAKGVLREQLSLSPFFIESADFFRVETEHQAIAKEQQERAERLARKLRELGIDPDQA